MKTSTQDQALKAARDHWDARLRGGAAAVKAWVTATILAVAIAFICVFYALGAATAPKYVGQVLTVNPATGETSFPGMLRVGSSSLDDNKMRFLLRQFIIQIRSISSDLYVIKQNIYNASFYTTETGTLKLASMIKEYDPIGLFSEKKTVDIRFVEYIHLSEKTWHVRWYEDLSIAGRPAGTTMKEGNFTWESSSPANDEAAILNPFMNSISDFTINNVRSSQ